ncbi:MAG: hypothetical protein RMK01_04060 [Thermomicrobium sp.]|nr:hypothetical protein [Thermomicrobium sp.]
MKRFGRPVAYEPTPWLRGPARFRNDYFELDLRRAEEYQPYEHRGQVFEFAELKTPAQALRFIERYGLLWAGPGAQEHRESWGDWLREIRTMNVVLDLAATVRWAHQGKREALDRLQEYGPRLSEFFEAPASTTDELLAQASTFVAWVVSEGLDGVEQRVSTAVLWEWQPGTSGPPGTWLFVVRAPHLLAYLYHDLAMLLVQRAPYEQCPECRRFFPRRDARQRFCSDQCADRHRYRRWLQRHGGRRPKRPATDP